ncbi:MAG: hypothetical protein HRT66_04670 [Flavobacteriaceae bacterium]|nr:hypothetical protein [Flavobacteriaceae bacterium]
MKTIINLKQKITETKELNEFEIRKIYTEYKGLTKYKFIKNACTVSKLGLHELELLYKYLKTFNEHYYYFLNTGLIDSYFVGGKQTKQRNKSTFKNWIGAVDKTHYIEQTNL